METSARSIERVIEGDIKGLIEGVIEGANDLRAHTSQNKLMETSA
jgi:hypothetical protein